MGEPLVPSLHPALALFALGCSDPEGPAEPWHIGVYMAADNNLDGAASADLQEMIDADLPPGVQVTIFIDRTEPGTYSRAQVPGLTESGHAKILRLEEDEVVELEDLGEVDSLSVDQLSAFVKRIAESGSERTALILWDHGAARSFGADQTNGSPSLDLQALRRAFRRDPDDAAAGDYTFDVVGADACSLSSLDALEVLGPVASVYVAGAELEPGPGWDYEGLLNRLADPDLNPESFGRYAVETYGAFYLTGESNRRITLAAWRTDTETFNGQVAALNDAANALAAQGGASDLYRGAQRAVGQSIGYATNPNGTARLIDAGDFLAALAAEEALGTEVAEAAASVRDALVADRIAFVASDPLADALGLSIVNNASDIAQQGFLPEALGDGSEGQMALAATDAAPPQVTLTYDDTTPGDIAFGLVTFGASDDVILTQAQVTLAGTPAGGDATVYAIFDVGSAVGRVALDPAAYGVPLTALSLTSANDPPADEDLALLYLDDFGAQLFVNLRYGGVDHFALLVLDDAFEPVSVVIEDGTAGTFSVASWTEVQRYPGATLTPILVGAAGLLAGRARPLSEVSVAFIDLRDSRTLEIIGSARDVAGQFASTNVAVP